MLRLRPATLDDLALLKYWDTKQHVIDCDPDDDWHWETELNRNPDWREQLIAEYRNEAIGFLQIIDPYREDTHYWGEIEAHKRAIDIWIGEEKHLSKGFGTAMMRLAIQRCFENPNVNGILIDPLKTNIRAHRFYEKLGFQYIEERNIDGTACYIYELKKEQYNRCKPPPI